MSKRLEANEDEAKKNPLRFLTRGGLRLDPPAMDTVGTEIVEIDRSPRQLKDCYSGMYVW